jgi:hypothetical protein
VQVRFAIAGFLAASAFITAAHAQTTVAADKADRPWYDRFTASAGLNDQDKGFTAGESRTALSFAPSAKWGVTLNMRDANRLTTEPNDEASFGAFYNVSPRFRVGGQLSVAAQQPTVRLPVSPTEQQQAAAGVKLESAFKF